MTQFSSGENYFLIPEAYAGYGGDLTDMEWFDVFGEPRPMLTNPANNVLAAFRRQFFGYDFTDENIQNSIEEWAGNLDVMLQLASDFDEIEHAQKVLFRLVNIVKIASRV